MPALQPASIALSAHREALYEATDPAPEARPSRPRNHLAIAQLSSALNISLGLKRAVDAKAIGTVVRHVLRERGIRAGVHRCWKDGVRRTWSELRLVDESGDAYGLDYANCGVCGSTVCRESRKGRAA